VREHQRFPNLWHSIPDGDDGSVAVWLLQRRPPKQTLLPSSVHQEARLQERHQGVRVERDAPTYHNATGRPHQSRAG